MPKIEKGKRVASTKTLRKRTSPAAEFVSAAHPSPTGQLESILAELHVIRVRLDYLIAQINGLDSGSIQ